MLLSLTTAAAGLGRGILSTVLAAAMALPSGGAGALPASGDADGSTDTARAVVYQAERSTNPLSADADVVLLDADDNAPVVPRVGEAWSGPNDTPEAGEQTGENGDPFLAVTGGTTAATPDQESISVSFNFAAEVTEATITCDFGMTITGWETETEGVTASELGNSYLNLCLPDKDTTVSLYLSNRESAEIGDQLAVIADYTMSGGNNGTLYGGVRIVDPDWLPMLSVSEAMTESYGGKATVGFSTQARGARIEELDVCFWYPGWAMRVDDVTAYGGDVYYDNFYPCWHSDNNPRSLSERLSITFDVRDDQPEDVGGGRESNMPVVPVVKSCIVNVNGELIDVTGAFGETVHEGRVVDPKDNGATIYFDTAWPMSDSYVIRAEIACRNDDANVWISAYGGDGKMLSVQVEGITDTGRMGQYAGLSLHTFDIPDGAEMAKVMVLDQNLRPIAVSATISVPQGMEAIT